MWEYKCVKIFSGFLIKINKEVPAKVFFPGVTPKCFHAVIYCKFIYFVLGAQKKILYYRSMEYLLLGNDDFSCSFTLQPIFC